MIAPSAKQPVSASSCPRSTSATSSITSTMPITRGEHQRLKLRVLPLVGLERVPPAGADRPGLGVLGRVDDDLILELGNLDDRLALFARALLAGKFVGDRKLGEAAWASDVDRP